MPAPDGREWLTSRQIAARLGKALLEDERIPQELREYLLAHKAVALDVMEDAFVSTGYTQEFKILRLMEMVVMAVNRLEFGPLFIPNTVDVNGDKIPTPVGQLWALFRDIYTLEFLEQFDEEGNPLEPL